MGIRKECPLSLLRVNILFLEYLSIKIQRKGEINCVKKEASLLLFTNSIVYLEYTWEPIGWNY